MRRGCITLLLLALAVIFATGVASAGERSGTEVLEFYEYIDIGIDVDKTPMRLTVDVTVTEGVPVNVFFMDDEGFDEYVATAGHDFTYDKANSKNNTDGFHRQFTVRDEGVHHLVIENKLYSSMDTSTVEYEVSWEEGTSWFGPWCWPIIIIILLLLALGGGYTFWRRRSGTGVGAPRMSPGALEGATHLGPQPEPPDSEAVSPPGEGIAELSPQPEPPDSEDVSPPGEGMAELSPQPEPPDTKVTYPSEGVIQLSPQPEPPDTAVTYPTEGVTQLSPQPEPPDARGSSATVGEGSMDQEAPAAHTTTYYGPGGTAQAPSVRPEPPLPEPMDAHAPEPSLSTEPPATTSEPMHLDAPERTPGDMKQMDYTPPEDEGFELEDRERKPPDTGGEDEDGPTGEPL
jgi:hypothetical protein